jgi:hypothetical protein
MFGAVGMSRRNALLIGRHQTPKVVDAQVIWSNYPSEIASDLSRYHHRRISEWHSGEMKSLELLELLEHMDEDSAFKTALREGEPSEHRKAVLQIANEIAVLRAVQAEGVDGDQWGSRLFFTPRKLKELGHKEEIRSRAAGSIDQIGARKA